METIRDEEERDRRFGKHVPVVGRLAGISRPVA
jgi:hypothetical protein